MVINHRPDYYMGQKVTDTNLLCDTRTYILLQIVNVNFQFEMEKPFDTDLKYLLLWRHQFGPIASHLL